MNAISIMYHDVVACGGEDASGFSGPAAALYKLTPDGFEQHLDAIEKAKIKLPARVSDAAAQAGGDPPLFLTFDDGGRSAHAYIADRLERKGWRGHFFVTTDYIDTPSFLSRVMIQDLHCRGHVIGSHTCSHPVRMSHCRWEVLLREWRESVAVLSDIVGENVRVASVPGGYYSRRVAEAAALAGIDFLFTSEPTTVGRQIGHCLVFGRYAVQRQTSPETAAGLAGGKWLPGLKQRGLWSLKKAAKAVGGTAYLHGRQALLGRNRAS